MGKRNKQKIEREGKKWTKMLKPLILREIHFNEVIEKELLIRIVEKVRNLIEDINNIKKANKLIEIARLNL